VECQVCQVRSAIGRCEESNKLVCEECSTGCYRCGKRIAVTAGHQTKSGHLYCTPCYKERADRKAGRSRQAEGGENLGLIDDEPQVARRPGAPEAEQEEAVEETVLSRWEPPAPWKMSLYLAGAAILLSLFFMFFPGYRTISFGATAAVRYIPLGLFGLLLAAMAVAWSVIGLLGQRFLEQRTYSFIGLFAAIVAGILSIAVTKPPVVSDLDAIPGSAQSRQFTSDTEREQYRNQFLSGQKRR
jgi:hypothetical protein